MARNRFVRPDTKRLPISDGDYVDVKARLNHGEREDFFAAIAPFDNEGKSKINRQLLRTTRLTTYVLGWSLVDADGKPVPMSPDMPEAQRLSTIRGLDTETFDEIHSAILKHEEANEKEREARKNSQGGALESPATSASPEPVTGPITTSET